MSPKRLSMAALVTVAILTASAFAQNNELSGIIGRTFISDQGVKGSNLFNNDVHFGKGLTFGFNYGRHIWGEGFTRVTFEVPVVIDLDQDLNYAANSVPSSYQSYFVTPSLRANIFAMTAISPWISAGGGFGHFRPADHLEFGGASGAKSSTTGVMQIGIGLDVRLKSRFSLRGEARDFWSGAPNILVDTGRSRQHNYLVGGGIVWRFGK